jgi:hypothetical protein
MDNTNNLMDGEIYSKEDIRKILAKAIDGNES